MRWAWGETFERKIEMFSVGQIEKIILRARLLAGAFRLA